MVPQKEMPRYQCHKKVWALKIESVSWSNGGDNLRLTFEDEGYAPLDLEEDYFRKHHPVAGGYYVVYEDGYNSFSPAKAFEDGYTRLTD